MTVAAHVWLQFQQFIKKIDTNLLMSSRMSLFVGWLWLYCSRSASLIVWMRWIYTDTHTHTCIHICIYIYREVISWPFGPRTSQRWLERTNFSTNVSMPFSPRTSQDELCPSAHELLKMSYALQPTNFSRWANRSRTTSSARFTCVCVCVCVCVCIYIYIYIYIYQELIYTYHTDICAHVYICTYVQ